jgi:hypothetical protein
LSIDRIASVSVNLLRYLRVVERLVWGLRARFPERAQIVIETVNEKISPGHPAKTERADYNSKTGVLIVFTRAVSLLSAQTKVVSFSAIVRSVAI